jgi:tRNA-specific 2-thiouridylase
VKRIAVLLSGGVDSAVALARLRRRGEAGLTAFYLKIWLEDEMAFLGTCPWEDDLRYARATCDLLRVPLEVVPLQKEYHERVVTTALEELRAGRTPSPDVLCNRRIKLGAFVERLDQEADRLGWFDLVATGHHARVRLEEEDRPGQGSALVAHLLRGVDPVKDQTYFLSQLTQAQLQRCCFPVGDLRKSSVRRLAREWGLPSATRPDSQGICFLGRVPYDAFIELNLGEQPGPIVEAGTRRVLGTHRGHWFHTIGQRRGLGLAGGPWYVVAKDVAENLIVVAHATNLECYRRSRFRIEQPSWLAYPPRERRLEVRIRHGKQLSPCEVEIGADGGVDVTMNDADAGIAPGQYAVLYHREECLGGGVMSWPRSSETEGMSL